MSTNELLDKASAEIVEEILAATGREGAEPWFFIIRRKLQSLLRELKARQK